MTIQRITFSSEHLIRQSRLHTRQPMFGSHVSYPEDINSIIDSINPASALDYGCGKGLAGMNLAERKQINVGLYDPFVNGFDYEPLPADLVICWNVLNNVEEQFLPAIVDHLYELTLKDLIVKFPLQKNNARYYLNYFRKFGIRSISNKICNITIFDELVAVEKPVAILTVRFVKNVGEV